MTLKKRERAPLKKRERAHLAQPTTTVATSHEPLGKLNPRVAAGSRSVRIAAIQRLRAFYQAYREALDRYLEHLERDIERAREVVFPAGTYLMRVRYSVQCQAPP